MRKIFAPMPWEEHIMSRYSIMHSVNIYTEVYLSWQSWNYYRGMYMPPITTGLQNHSSITPHSGPWIKAAQSVFPSSFLVSKGILRTFDAIFFPCVFFFYLNRKTRNRSNKNLSIPAPTTKEQDSEVIKISPYLPRSRKNKTPNDPQHYTLQWGCSSRLCASRTWTFVAFSMYFHWW